MLSLGTGKGSRSPQILVGDRREAPRAAAPVHGEVGRLGTRASCPRAQSALFLDLLGLGIKRSEERG